MQKITPFLWFDNNAEEAVEFYTSVFTDSAVLNVSRYGEAGPGKNGTIMSATFQICGQQFMVLNGGPHFKFTEAVSFFINCGSQQEVDELWEKLSADGGQKGRCGWLKDKFGLSWQVIPTAMGRFLGGKDPRRSQNAMRAMMQMDKIDLQALEDAYNAD